MIPRSEADIRIEYADLFDAEEEDADLVRLAQVLDAGYRQHRAPLAVRLAPPTDVPGRLRDRLAASSSETPERGAFREAWRSSIRMLTTRQVVWSLLLACMLLLAATISLARSPQTDPTSLGAPTRDRAQFPLGAFRHTPFTLPPVGGKPEVLFIGTQIDDRSASERWPVVKALSRFGRFSGIVPLQTRERVCSDVGPTSSARCNFSVMPEYSPPAGGFPTFDWTHAVYRSPYVSFVHKDLIDGELMVHNDLTPLERALFARYVRQPGATDWNQALLNAAVNNTEYASLQFAGHQFPLVMIGGYLETAAQVAIPGDVMHSVFRSQVPLSFRTVQASLRQGKPVHGAPLTLITDYNAEANIITALICHADGSRPRSVCARSPIPQLIKARR